ncbi:CinA family protein [Halomonas sp. M20]|uniref:CinA family protein n=1 Tax=Halomonas sp. M20 TaxID=2763264 RepID=UPI001D0AB305|nr:CinA family protein [Halomonas sp. M20]
MSFLENVTQYLIEHELKLATAESCTAGLMVSELARIPGSGQAIDCGLGVYSPEAKNRYLGVRYATIDNFGLTSEETSREMALGALDNNHADLAIANTGIAGPQPQGDIPVGTVCFAWAFRHAEKKYLYSETRRFNGDRNDVRLAAAHHALERVLYYHQAVLEGKAPPL